MPSLQVSKFMRTYGDLELFPVKIQIPIILSMRVTVNVKNICVWSADTADARCACAKAPPEMRVEPPLSFLRPPEGYSRMTLEELTAEKRTRKAKKARDARLSEQAAVDAAQQQALASPTEQPLRSRDRAGRDAHDGPRDYQAELAASFDQDVEAAGRDAERLQASSRPK